MSEDENAKNDVKFAGDSPGKQIKNNDLGSRKRTFLRFAGAGIITALANRLIHPALGSTWTQVGTAATGATGTWRLISPMSVPTPLKSSIACGYAHDVALRSDGLVFACGTNSYGQLGINSTTSQRTFVQATGISNAVAIAAGVGHTLALRSDGLIFAAGFNNAGQLGVNSTTSQRTFIQATGISNAVAVACQGTNSVVLRSDGLVLAAGGNTFGQLGINSTTNSSTFVQAIGISNAVAVACGENFSVALRSDGLVFATGYNDYGQLGINSAGIGASCSTFVQATGISNAIAIAAGYIQNVALRSDGLVFACGYNGYGQLGINSTGGDKMTFVQATGISNAIAVACGYYHSVALRSDGLVFSCGYNSSGQLGINSAALAKTYVQATGISNAIAIAGGGGPFGAQTIALRSDGVVFSCGYNNFGQLDINSTVNQSTFVQAL